MACETITLSQKRKCRTGAGGIKRFYFATFPEQHLNVTYDAASNMVQSVTSGTTLVDVIFYDYTPQKNTGEFVQPETVSDSGFGYEPTISMFFAKMEQETTDKLRVFTISNVLSIHSDNNGNFFLIGIGNGITGEPGSTNSGKAISDPNGYNVVLKGAEALPAVQIDPAYIQIADDGTLTIGTV